MLKQAATYTAVASAAAAALLAHRGDPAALVGLLLVVSVVAAGSRLAAGGVFHAGHVPDRRRAGAFAASLLIISAMVLGGAAPGGSMVGVASADVEVAIDNNTCSTIDMFAHIASWSVLNQGKCSIDVKSVNTTDNSDLNNFAMATSVDENAELYQTTTSNRLKDARSVVWSKAKIEIVQAMNNGSSQATAELAAKSAVQEYYSRMEYNTVQQWNAYVSQIEYINDSSVTVQATHFFNSGRGSTPINSFGTTNYTLVNGSTVSVRTIVTGAGTAHIGDNGGVNELKLRVDDPTTGSTDYSTVLAVQKWVDLADKFPTQHSQVQGNVNTYASSVYSQYNQGDLNASDLLDPQTLAQTANANYNGTGYYGYAAANLAALGYSGNLSASHTVEVRNSTGAKVANFSGTLYYTGSDISRFNTSQSYNFSNLSGTVYMVVQRSESAQLRDLSKVGSEMTITKAVNTRTGETLNQTKIEQKTYSTHNASNLKTELQKLRDLREEIQEMSSSGAGGGGSSGGGVNQTLVIVVLAVGIGALLMRERNQNGGGRRRR